MAAKILNFPSSLDDPSEWGGCPKCHRNDGYLNTNRRDHFFICHRHKVKWCIGSNLFSAWRDMSDQELTLQHMKLAGYREVEPWYARWKATKELAA